MEQRSSPTAERRYLLDARWQETGAHRWGESSFLHKLQPLTPRQDTYLYRTSTTLPTRVGTRLMSMASASPTLRPHQRASCGCNCRTDPRCEQILLARVSSAKGRLS